MKVTQTADHITHAVITGREVEECGIDDSPEMYHLLSAALYSNKPLAVAREVICNAWDAHIDAGITDTPVKVTLTHEKLIIQDFGKGIPHDQIREIYGVYGKSTKVADGRVTGGFGLGSKSPWAYVDHFGVTSCHEGKKTIYRMSKSSGVVLGKPAIIPIVTVPTEESGLTVEITLKQKDDRSTFQEIIQRLVYLGDMKVELNGALLETIAFDKAENGFMLVRSDKLEPVGSLIRVRYGNVVYPVEPHHEYAGPYKEAIKFIQRVGVKNSYYYDHNYWTLIIQAPPHSISITPSRESISMTDHTITTLKGLLQKFVKTANDRFQEVLERINNDIIKQAWLIAKPGDLMQPALKLPIYQKLVNKSATLPAVGNFDELAMHYLNHRYPDWGDFANKDFHFRLESLVNSGFGNDFIKGLLATFLREYRKYRWNHNTYSNWLQRRYFWKVMKKLDAVGIDASKLLVFGGHPNEEGLVHPVKHWTSGTAINMLPFLRGIVILAHNRQEIGARAGNFPICQHWLGAPHNSLAYIIPRKSKKLQAIRDGFAATGLTVIDLTKRHPWEPEQITQPIPKPVPSALKVVGLPRLDQAIVANRLFVSAHHLLKKRQIRIEKPEFVMTVGPRRYDYNDFSHWNNFTTAAIIRRWGDRGGAAANAAQLRRYISKGAKESRDFVYEKLNEAFHNDPEIRTYFEHDLSDHDDCPETVQKFIDIILHDNELQTELNLPKGYSHHVDDLILIWTHISNSEKKRNKQLSPILDLMKTWQVNKSVKQFASKVIKAKTSLLFDIKELGKVLDPKNTAYTEKQRKTARKMVLLSLKG